MPGLTSKKKKKKNQQSPLKRDITAIIKHITATNTTKRAKQ